MPWYANSCSLGALSIGFDPSLDVLTVLSLATSLGKEITIIARFLQVQIQY